MSSLSCHKASTWLITIVTCNIWSHFHSIITMGVLGKIIHKIKLNQKLVEGLTCALRLVLVNGSKVQRGVRNDKLRSSKCLGIIMGFNPWRTYRPQCTTYIMSHVLYEMLWRESQILAKVFVESLVLGPSRLKPNWQVMSRTLTLASKMV